MDWLSKATVFCLPSEYEGHPLVVMEAAAFGVPVVATSISGIRDVISDAGLGLLVPVSNVEALAEALHHVIVDPEAAATLGRNPRSVVASRFSWKRTARLYFDLAYSLLDR